MPIEKLVVLDRDGVINQDSDDYIRSPSEWLPLPGSLDAIVALSAAGFRIAVVSNQSGLARNYFDHGDLNRMHRKMRDLVVGKGGQIEMILFCPHHPKAGCSCRKPEPGLLLELSRRTGIDLRGAPMIGDSLADIQAARKVGMQPMLVLTGKGRRTAENLSPEIRAVPRFEDLRSAVQELLVRWCDP